MHATARRFARLLLETDGTDRLPRLRAGVLFLVALPGLSLCLDLALGRLDPLPFSLAIRHTGDWALYLLLASLAVRPAARLFERPDLNRIARIVGLAALSYGLAHAVLFWLDQRFSLGQLASELIWRPGLLTGLVALAGLAVLGAASADRAARRLSRPGGYLSGRLAPWLAALLILHALLQSKLDATGPLLLCGFLFWLMGYRLLETFRVRLEARPLTALSVAAAASAMAVEIAWYHAARSVPVPSMVAAEFYAGIAIRPAWWVLAAGLAVALAVHLRGPGRGILNRALGSA